MKALADAKRVTAGPVAKSSAEVQCLLEDGCHDPGQQGARRKMTTGDQAWSCGHEHEVMSRDGKV